MAVPRPFIVVFWAVVIAAPFAMCGLALATLPAGVTEIPIQVGFDGQVNRYGDPAELWAAAALMAGCNLLMALCYVFNDFLYDHGFVHGASRKGALRVYVICAVVLVVVDAFCDFLLVGLA